MPKNIVQPASEWATGNRSAHPPFADPHLRAACADLAMTPAIARWIIETYTSPGEIICDPNPGPGVVLAETVRAGRHALALPTEPRWESALQANLDLARPAHNAGHATLLDGIDDPRAADLPGAIDLVLTGLRYTPASDPSQVLVGLYEDLTAIVDWIWPGGHVAITCRPWRRHGRLLDLPGTIHDAAAAVGLVPADHCIGLTAPGRGKLVRSGTVSGAHLANNTDFPTPGTAQSAHLDVLVFRLLSHSDDDADQICNSVTDGNPIQ